MCFEAIQSQLGETLNGSLALNRLASFTVETGKNKMKYGKPQNDVRLWPEEQVKALSHDWMVLAHDHEAFGDLLKPRSDEVALHQLRASARMSHTLVMRIRQEVFVPLKYLLHNQES